LQSKKALVAPPHGSSEHVRASNDAQHFTYTIVPIFIAKV
jgi:hypothetical protein